MKKLHQIVGLFIVVAFLLTGQFMEFHQPRMEELDDGTRMMFRSRHIYILMAGLVNLGVGVYFNYRRERWRQSLQVAGSILILVAPFLLLCAFFYEPTLQGMQRTFTLPAIVAISVGALCHLFSGMSRRKNHTTA